MMIASTNCPVTKLAKVTLVKCATFSKYSFTRFDVKAYKNSFAWVIKRIFRNCQIDRNHQSHKNIRNTARKATCHINEMR